MNCTLKNVKKDTHFVIKSQDNMTYLDVGFEFSDPKNP